MGITLDVQKAVSSPDCKLRSEVRHLVMVFALKAKGTTGVGFSSQATIAPMLGVSARHVRRLLAELDDAVARGESPVRIVRTPRFRPGGRGRTSDEYSVELTKRTGESGYSSASSGQESPVGPVIRPATKRTGPTRLTGQIGSTKRTPRSGHDPLRDPRSDQRSTCASQSDTPKLTLENPSPSKPKRKTRSKPTTTTEAPDPRVHQLKQHYVEEYQRTIGVAPVLLKRQWPIAMRAFKELLTVLNDLDAAKLIVTRAFANEWQRTKRRQPWEIVADANKLNGGAKERTTRKPLLRPQHHDVEVFDGCQELTA